MKQQCETSAQCLKELARVMEQFGFTDIHDALKSQYCKWGGDYITNSYHILDAIGNYSEHLTCAIAEVEGKPVFVNDDLYDLAGNRFTVEWFDDGVLYGVYPCASSASVNIKSCSWNPPRPKTVMVELPLEVAEVFNHLFRGVGAEDLQEVAKACRKALEGVE